MYNPDHPDADYSGFVSRKQKNNAPNQSTGGHQMANIFAEPSVQDNDGSSDVPYKYDSGAGGLIGGPAYKGKEGQNNLQIYTASFVY